MEHSLVSVVIPAYNCSGLIEPCLRSVVRQNYRNIEVIVVDDGSTDRTKEVILGLMGQNNTIKYYFQENQGPGAARNRGMLEASGEYIAFLDADDQLLEDSLAERTRFLTAVQEAGLVFSDYYDLDSDSEVAGQIPRLSEFSFKEHFTKVNEELPHAYIAGTGFLAKYLTYHPYPVWTGTVMIRKTAVQRAGLFRTDVRSGEDHDYWIRVLECARAGYINKPLAVYRRQHTGLSSSRERHLRESLVPLEDWLRHRSVPAGIVKKELAAGYYALGCEYSKQKFPGQARQYFWKAVQCAPFSLKNWIATVSPGEGNLRFVRALKNRLTGG